MWPCRQNCIRRDRFAQDVCFAKRALSAHFPATSATIGRHLCTNDLHFVQTLRSLSDAGDIRWAPSKCGPGRELEPRRIATTRRARHGCPPAPIAARIGGIRSFLRLEERTASGLRKGARFGGEFRVGSAGGRLTVARDVPAASRHAVAATRSLIMRSLLTLLVAPFLVLAVVVCVLLLEPVRWCVVRTRPWRRR